MEPTKVYDRDYIGIMENQMEKNMENEMDIVVVPLLWPAGTRGGGAAARAAPQAAVAAAAAAAGNAGSEVSPLLFWRMK